MNTFTKTRLVAGLMCAILWMGWLSAGSLSVSGKGKPGGSGGGGSGPSYQIIELDSAGGLLDCSPWRINNPGLIVGEVYSPELEEVFAACWTVDASEGSVTSTLHLLDGNRALGVNDAGEIVGERNGDAVYWSSRTATPLVLPAPAGSTWVSAMGINNDGVVCGWIAGKPDSNGNIPHSAVVWRINVEIVDGNPTPTVWGPLMLPALAANDLHYAEDINDNNAQGEALVVGTSNNAETNNALTWTVVSRPDGSLSAAGPVLLEAGEVAVGGVNNSDIVCGTVHPDAVVWDGGSRQVLDKSATWVGWNGLATISWARARTMNAGGVVVGHGLSLSGSWHSKAAVWSSPTSSMVLLDDFIRKTAFTELNRATSINDAGAIVGWGWNSERSSYPGFLALPK